MDLLTALTAAIFALAGVVLGHVLAARADNRTERWRRREETMRMLRWAVELVASDNARGSTYGATTLEALLDSELLQPEDSDVVLRLAHRARAEAGPYTDDESSQDEGADPLG